MDFNSRENISSEAKPKVESFKLPLLYKIQNFFEILFKDEKEDAAVRLIDELRMRMLENIEGFPQMRKDDPEDLILFEMETMADMYRNPELLKNKINEYREHLSRNKRGAQCEDTDAEQQRIKKLQKRAIAIHQFLLRKGIPIKNGYVQQDIINLLRYYHLIRYDDTYDDVKIIVDRPPPFKTYF